MKSVTNEIESIRLALIFLPYGYHPEVLRYKGEDNLRLMEKVGGFCSAK